MKKLALALLLTGATVGSFAAHPLTSATLSDFTKDEKKLSINGYVKDATTGEELIGVSIYIQETKTGTTSNVYGYYSLSLEAGTYTVQYTYVGYQPVIRTIKLSQDTQLNMELVPVLVSWM